MRKHYITKTIAPSHKQIDVPTSKLLYFRVVFAANTTSFITWRSTSPRPGDCLHSRARIPTQTIRSKPVRTDAAPHVPWPSSTRQCQSSTFDIWRESLVSPPIQKIVWEKRAWSQPFVAVKSDRIGGWVERTGKVGMKYPPARENKTVKYISFVLLIDCFIDWHFD